jgi:hypothetical protein
VPAPTAAAPIIVEVTPTNSPFAPEEANAGSHHYWMSPNEAGCPASDNLKTPNSEIRNSTSRQISTLSSTVIALIHVQGSTVINPSMKARSRWY